MPTAKFGPTTAWSAYGAAIPCRRPSSARQLLGAPTARPSHADGQVRPDTAWSAYGAAIPCRRPSSAVGSAAGEPLGAVGAEAGEDLAVKGAMGPARQLRVGLDQGERVLPGLDHPVVVLGQAGQLEVGQARLPGVEHGALAPDAEVLVGQLEAVVGTRDRLHAGAALVGDRVGEQDAKAGRLASADPPPQLGEDLGP